MWNERLRMLREEKDLTQNELAKLLGLNYKTIYRYENGICEPTLSVLVKLAAIFDTSIDYLCGIGELKNYKNEVLSDKLKIITNQLDNLISSFSAKK